MTDVVDLADSLQDIPKRAVALKLKGIPFDATKKQVKRWFTEDDITVKAFLIRRRDGKGNGIGYAVLRHKDDEERALKKSNTMMGGRYILVTKVSVLSVKKQFDRFKAHGAVVHLAKLPVGTTEEDIQNFFEGLEIVDNGININVTGDGQWTGKALVEFASDTDSAEALKKYGHQMGETPIKIWPSTVHQYRKMVHVKKFGRPLKTKSKKKQQGDEEMNVDESPVATHTPVVSPSAEGKKKKGRPSVEKRKRMKRKNMRIKALAKKENWLLQKERSDEEMEIDGRKRKHVDEGKVAKKKRKTPSGAVETDILKIKKTKKESANDAIEKEVLSEMIEEAAVEKKKKKKKEKKNKGGFAKEETITSMLSNVNGTDKGQSVQKKKKEKNKPSFKVKSHSSLEKMKKKRLKKMHSS